jgi:hypothetical protein
MFVLWMIATVCAGILFLAVKDPDGRWAYLVVYGIVSLLLFGMAWVFADKKKG